MTIARRPIASIEQVDGLQGALDNAEFDRLQVEAVGTVIDDCSSVTPWSRFVLDNATVTVETSEPKFPTFLRLTAVTAAATGRRGRDLNIDLSAGGALSFWVRVNDANLAYMTVTLCCKDYTGGPTLGWPAGNGIQSPRSSNMDVGRWHRIVITAADIAMSSGVVLADSADVTGILIAFTGVAGQVASIDIADMRWHEPSAIGGRVVWLTDDGFASTYTEMFPRLAAVGHVGCVAVDRNKPGTANYMTVANINALYAAGWDIVGHDTGGYVSTRNVTQAETDIRLAVQYMKDNGWTRGSRIWVWPQGERNTAMQAVADRHFSLCRRVTPWCNDAHPALCDPTNIPLFYVTSAKTLATVKAALDKTAATNTTRVLVFHDIGGAQSEDWTVADFAELVTYADSLGLKSARLSQLFPVIR